MKLKKVDFITSIILLGLTAFFLYQTSLLQSSNVDNEMGPRFFPYVCLIAIGVFSIALLVNSLKIGKRTKEAETDKVDEGAGQYTIKEAMIYFGMILLIIIAVYFIGFTVAMAVGVGTILYFTGWKPLKAGIFSVVVVAVVVIIFQVLIDIPLPKGVLF